jgi:N-acetylglucosamine malate deacetylase 1
MEIHMSRRPEARSGEQRREPPSSATLPARILDGRLLVLAPHMDDETLACGGTILLHRRKPDVHCMFATDGAASPAPLLPWLGRPDAGIVERRRREAIAATARLGLPAGNLHFLGLPDGGLARHQAPLKKALDELVARLRPDFVFAPFRFDVHPDHVALNRAIRAVLGSLEAPPLLLEYFVYHRLRFVPGGDVRQAVRPGRLVGVDTAAVAAEKREAVDSYASQTTIGYAWQDRPTLTEASLAERCAEPEFFLPTNPAAPLAEDVVKARQIQFAALAMRLGKRPKDRAVAFARWALGR